MSIIIMVDLDKIPVFIWILNLSSRSEIEI